jgi:DNA-binding NarL/FixJ family response regulator
VSTVVVLASADGLYRAGIASLLRGAGFIVVEVADVPSAVSATIEHRSPVCVLDTDLDAGVHAHATRRLAAGGSARIVALASARTESDMLGVIRNGGSGFVPKTTTADGLVRAVNAVLAGHLAIPRQAIAILVDELQGRCRQTWIGDQRVALTSRERNVLDLLEDGLTTQEIASRLGIAAVTVRRHLGAIAAKAGAEGVAQLRLLVRA